MKTRQLAYVLLQAYSFEDMEEACQAAKGIKHEVNCAFYYEFADDTSLHYSHITKEWSAQC